MGSDNIKSIFVYNLNKKNIIIGKLNNISKNEKLGNIRPKITKMSKDDDFISIKNKEIDIIDKDIENQIILNDILINENGESRIYINNSNNNEIKNNNNNNLNEPEQNNNCNGYNTNINYNNNNLVINGINQFQNNIEFLNGFNNIENQNNMMNIMNFNHLNNYKKLLNFIFEDNHGNQVEIETYSDVGVCDLLLQYLEKIDYFELDLRNIQFLYNNINIDYNDQTNIDEYFKDSIQNGENDIRIYVNDINNLIKLIKIKYEDNHNKKVEILFKKKDPIENIIKRYLYHIRRSELVGIVISGEIQFVYNNNNLDCYDNTTLEEYFNNDNNPIIHINDLNDLLISEKIEKYNITFKTSQGSSILLESFIESKIERIIFNFFKYIEHPELIKKRDNIQFLYNGERINENISAIKCFKNESNPNILVMDLDNLLINILANNENDSKYINVFFRTERGRTIKILVKFGTTVENLLEKFLLKLDYQPEINLFHKEILFRYNTNDMYFYAKKVVEQVFGNITNPKVNVNFLNQFKN